MKNKLRITSIIMALVMMLSVAGYASTTVYTTATGSKYHSTTGCRGLNNARAIYSESESSAISKGLTKCSICWNSSSSSTTTVTKTVAKTTTKSIKTSAYKSKYALTVTIKKGQKLKVKLAGNKKKVKWTRSNKKIKITKKNNKYAIAKGLKKGTSILKAKIGKRIYRIKIRIK